MLNLRSLLVNEKKVSTPRTITYDFKFTPVFDKEDENKLNHYSFSCSPAKFRELDIQNAAGVTFYYERGIDPNAILFCLIKPDADFPADVWKGKKDKDGNVLKKSTTFKDNEFLCGSTLTDLLINCKLLPLNPRNEVMFSLELTDESDELTSAVWKIVPFNLETSLKYRKEIVKDIEEVGEVKSQVVEEI